MIAAHAPHPPLGDMDDETFRQAAHRLVDWIARYLDGGVEEHPVLSRIAPGRIRAALPPSAPAAGRSMPEILDDFERILVPGLTHWNHPGFMAYFASSGSAPGILGELLTAALNQQAMLWRTSPAASELEAVTLGWLRELLGLPQAFAGVIFDGGSSSNLHALLAARQAALPEARTRGLAATAAGSAPRVYCTAHAHSSIDKAAIVLGIGQQSLRRIDVDDQYRMRPDALAAALREDAAAGRLPLAVVATVGTTASAAVDPVRDIAELCAAHGVWLHVDASYGGPAAMLPEQAWIFDGVDRADSVVVNPHKWLFTPLDLSAFYCRRLEVLEAALALTPDYLANPEAGSVSNLMDTGIALGRRFRALKLWMVMSFFGADGLRARIAEHIRLAARFASWVTVDPDFELVVPPSLGLVCFRAAPAEVPPTELDELNAKLLARLNAGGEVYLSHTRLDGRFVIRLAVGQLRTAERHVHRAWELLRGGLDALRLPPQTRTGRPEVIDGGDTMPNQTTSVATRTLSRTLPTRSAMRLLSLAALVYTLLVGSPVFAVEVVHRGVPIPADKEITPLPKVISNPKEFTQEEFVTEGTVRKVCRLAGCWMSIASSDSSAAMRVTFKGGAFVVPRSSAGSHARLLGRVRIADDTVTFVASGVDLTTNPK